MFAPEDFTEYVAARRPALVRTAYLLCGDIHLAEDLVQGALIKAVGHWRRIGDHPEPWLRTVMARDSISRWRRHRREHLTDRPPESAVVGAEDHGVLVALAQLPPKQRAVVVLRYYEELTERETAEALGVSVGTVKSQHHDAIRRLRTLLPDHEGALS